MIVKKFVERKIGNYLMRIKAKEGGIHSSLRKMKEGSNKEREPEFLYVLKKEISPEMTCVDIGANIGYITLKFADMLKGKGKIFAIEPDPANFELLKYNVNVNKLDNIIECSSLAIGDKKETKKFYIAKSSNLNSMTQTKNTKRSIEVKCDTLTNFFKDKKIFPNLLKMDVEGHETFILDGAFEMFKNNDFPCKIAIEVHPQFYKGNNNFGKSLKKYSKIGFNPLYLISAGIAMPDKFKKLGYTNPEKVFKSSGYFRGVYKSDEQKKISWVDMIYLSSKCHNQYVEHRKKYSKKIVRYIIFGRT